LSDVLSVALLYNSVDKERHAEDILFHQYDLLHAGVPIGQSDRKDEWLSDNQLQPMRRLVEDINATRDWCEVLMSVNLVVEPLLGRLIYSEMLASSATRHGDHVTGVILAEAESDRQRNIEWTCALADMLLSDPQHGDRNRELINSFLGYWVAEVRVVMGTLSQVAERAGIDLDAATRRVTHDWKVLVEQCRLDVSQWDGSQTQAIATLS
jgi:propane monooxygenase small subunit